jgi:hypothetical protein
MSTLGRATLLVADQLLECPFDGPENLYVFLIILENPLMLNPSAFHVVIQRVYMISYVYYMAHINMYRYGQVVSGILAIPKSFRVMFFKWLRHFPSEYFARIIQVY